MAEKKVANVIKLQIPAGAANPAPPVGPALGAAGVNIMQFCRMSVVQELQFMEDLKLEGNMAVVAQQIIREITSRLRFLTDVGLSYLTLSRRLTSSRRS